MKRDQYGLLYDMVLCAGCRQCVVACKEQQGFPVPEDPEDVTELSAEAFTCMRNLDIDGDEYPARNLCRHCVEPACASVCPVGALQKTERGPVIYDPSKCMGCRYCMMACPFNVPRYEWNSPVPKVRKCEMCYERQLEGKPTACAEACAYEATLFGKREDLLEIARQRIAESPDDYYAHIYGETEVGGTCVLFLVPKAVAWLGFEGKDDTPMPVLTWRVLSKLPGISIGGGAALAAFWWITRRRDEVGLVERGGGRPSGNGKDRGHGVSRA